MDLRTETTDRLFEAILNLESLEECYRFFQDVCTIKELQDLSQRFHIAALLNQGRNYQSIAKEVDTSTTTISRVNHCLQYGSGGYRAAFDKMRSMREVP